MASLGGYVADRLQRNISQWLKTFNIHRRVDQIEMGQGAGAALLAGRWLEASFLATEWSGDAFLRQRSSGMLDRILGAQRPGEGPPFPEMAKADTQAIAGAMNTAAALWGNGPAAALADRMGGVSPVDRQGLDAAAVVRLTETERISAILPELSRVLDRTGDGVWGDAIEGLLWNQILACQSLEGDGFRAINPFRGATSEFGGEKAGSAGALMLAQVPWLYYAAAGDRIWVHQYGASEVNLRPGGKAARLVQVTSYPDGEDVALEIRSGSGEFELRLRIPGWCSAPSMQLNGVPQVIQAERGYAKLRRTWQSGDRIDLHFPMPLRQESELRRGPLLYYRNGSPLTKVLLQSLRPLPVGGPLGPAYEIRVILEGRPEATALLRPFALLGREVPGVEYTTALLMD